MAPPLGQFKVNVDGAFSKRPSKAGVGVVFRDTSGCVLDGASEPVLAS